MSFCSNCGGNLSLTDTFCSSCGEQVKSAKSVPGDAKSYNNDQRPTKYYRSRNNKVIAGVCGGLGEYFNIDPILVRIGFLFFGFMGAGVLVYIILALLVEQKPYNYNR